MRTAVDINSQLAFFHQNFQGAPEEPVEEEETKERFSDFLRDSVKNLIKQEFKEEISDQLDTLKKGRFRYFKRQLLANKSDIEGKISMNNSLISDKDKSLLFSQKSAEKGKKLDKRGRDQRIAALKAQLERINKKKVNAEPTGEKLNSGFTKQKSKTLNADTSQLSSTVDDTKMQLSVETTADFSISLEQQGRKLLEGTNETVLSDSSKNGLSGLQPARRKSKFNLLSLISPVNKKGASISFKEEEEEEKLRNSLEKKHYMPDEWKCNKIMAVIEKRKAQMLSKLQKDHITDESILNKVRQVSLEIKHKETRAAFVIYDNFNRFTGFKIILMELPIYNSDIHSQKMREDLDKWLDEAQKKLGLPHGLNFIFLINEKLVGNLIDIPEKCNILLVSSTPKSFFWKEVFKYHNLKKDKNERMLDEELDDIYKRIGEVKKPHELTNLLLSRESVSKLFVRNRESLHSSVRNIAVNESSNSSDSEENKDNKNWKLQKEIGRIISNFDDEHIEKEGFFEGKTEEEERAFYQGYIEGVYQKYEDSVGFTRDVRMKFEKKNQQLENLQTKYYVFDHDEISKNEKFAVGKAFEKILAQEVKRVENGVLLEKKRRSYKHRLYLEESKRLKENIKIHTPNPDITAQADASTVSAISPKRRFSVDIIKRNKERIMKEKDRVTDIINKDYHLLFHKNIPMIQGEHEFTRQEVHVFFSRFKAMLHYCYELSGKLRGQKGIDLPTFRKVMMEYFEVPHVQLLEGLYSLNKNTKPVEWDHFLLLMQTLNSSSIDQKIDTFLESMNINPHGFISAKEIKELSKFSIAAIINDERDREVVDILAETLCKIILGMYFEDDSIQPIEEVLSERSSSQVFGEEEEPESEIKIPVAALKKLMKGENNDVEFLLLLFCLKEEDLKGQKHDAFYQRIAEAEKKKMKQKEMEISQKAKNYLEKNFIEGLSQEEQSKLLSTWEKRLSMALDRYKNQESNRNSELFPEEAEAHIESKARIKDLIKIRRKSMLQNLGSFSGLSESEHSPKVSLGKKRKKR